jgi:hypothetical protein
MDRVFYNDTTIVNFLGMLVVAYPSMGLIVRQDWLDDLNLGKAIDITTYDKMEEVLTAFKQPTQHASPYGYTTLSK